jgi:hypothetical protein
MASKICKVASSAEYENTRSPVLHAIRARWENSSQTNLGEVARSVQKIPKEHNLEFPKRYDNKMGLVRTCGHGIQPDQLMLISAAVSAGMKQVVCVPAGVSVSALAGAKLPSLFTVAPWMVTPEVAARLDPVIVCNVAVWMF